MALVSVGSSLKSLVAVGTEVTLIYVCVVTIDARATALRHQQLT